MKVFTINQNGVTSGARVTSHQLMAGREIPAIVIGEEGRGRSIGFVPVKLTPASIAQLEEKGETRVCFVSAREVGDKMVFDQLDNNDDNSTGHVCLVLNFAYGYRGTVRYEFPEGVDILAEGIKADGQAGRMAGGPEYIIVAEGEAAILVRRTGRLYGGQSDFLVVVKDGEVTLTTPDEAWLEDISF